MFQDVRIEPPRDEELQVVFSTDAGFTRRVEVAVASLLEHLTCSARIMVISTDDAKDAFPRLEKIMKDYPRARLEYVFPQFLNRVALHPHLVFRAATFGRLLIPHLMEGRVHYVDGDTLVRHDLSSTRDCDLDGHLAAVTTDITLLRNVRRAARDGHATSKREKASVAGAVRTMNGFQGKGLDLQNYYNSGVMIFDCDAIRADAQLMEQTALSPLHSELLAARQILAV